MIRVASVSDIEEIILFDDVAMSSPERRENLSKAIADDSAWVIESDNAIRGYSLMSHNFFGRSFIDLIYISKDFRGKSLGVNLLLHLEKYSRSSQLFTSTNESNKHMQHVLEKLEYKKSGVIYNLDEGDPELVYVKSVDSG